MTDPPKLTATQIGCAAFTALAVPWMGAWIGSHTGTSGTVAGTAIGSILPVVAGWVFLRFTYHAKSGLARVPWRQVKPWHLAVASPVVTVAVFVVGMAMVTGVEARVLHKSLSAATTGSKDTGTTLGSVVDAHPANPSPSATEPPAATFAPSLSRFPSAPATVPASAATPTPTVAPFTVPVTSTRPAVAPAIATPSPITPEGGPPS